MKKKIQFALIIAIPIIICIIAVFLRISVNKSASVTIEGEIEIDLRSYYTQVTGEVTSLPVGIGQAVSKGDIIATLDDSHARFQLSLLEQSLIKTEASLQDLSLNENQTTKQSQIDIAKNNIIIAEQTLAIEQDILMRLQEDHTHLLNLYEIGSVSEMDLQIMTDKIKSQEKVIASAQAHLDSAQSQLNIASADTDLDMTEKKKIAQADINIIKTRIEYATNELEDYNIRALEDGVLISLAYDLGSYALMGTEICEISKENQKKFVFYLPEEYMDYINYDMEILIVAKNQSKDTPAKEYKATIQSIDFKAQYTPESAESSANKNRLSFKIEALLPPDCDLRVAQRASVTLTETAFP